MKILFDFGRTFPHLVVGIGNFDGVHRGHLKIIREIVKMAGPGGTSGIITFRHHTRLSADEQKNHLLTTVDQRLEYLEQAGISVCWIIDFNDEFAAQRPKDFILEVLVSRLEIKGICIGEGFRFGAGRKGSVETLKQLGEEHNFKVSQVPTIRKNGREIRSSIIRELIHGGNLEEANNLLGHEYCLTGLVVRGHGRGKDLGYPTANFYPEQLIPSAGVYAGMIEIGSEKKPGMLYVGTRPTFSSSGNREVVAEAHIFDWSGSLEGKRIKVCLNNKLRKDIKFNHSADLSQQISKDEKEARCSLQKNYIIE